MSLMSTFINHLEAFSIICRGNDELIKPGLKLILKINNELVSLIRGLGTYSGDVQL